MKQSAVEARIDGFIDRYAPAIATELRAARAHLRSLFPRGHELVFDNYNALVFGFAPGPRTSEAFLSIAAYPRWVTLFFLHGTRLHDPKGLLQGEGKQVRSIRLHSAAHLKEPAVEALIEEAMQPSRQAMLLADPLQTTIKMVSEKQRPRRPSSVSKIS